MMFKYWVFFFSIMTVGIMCGVFIGEDPGYVMIAYRFVTIEMPLWLAGIAVVAGLFVWGKITQIVQYIGGIPQRFRDYRLQKKEQKILQSVGDLFEAFVQGKEEKIQLLLKTVEQYPEMNFGARLFSVWVGLHQENFFAARDQLFVLEKKYPKHPAVLTLLKDFAIAAKDDRLLLKVIHRLQKQKWASSKELETLHRGALVRQLEVASGKETTEIAVAWKQTPKGLKEEPELLKAYVDALLRLGDVALAEKSLRQYLVKQHNISLLMLYAGLEYDPQKRLAFLEKLRQERPEGAVIAQALGDVAKQNALWGKAIEYYEEALRQTPLPAIFLELARLYEKIEKRELAIEYYKRGLIQSTMPSER